MLKYKRTGGSYIDLTKEDYVLPLTQLQVLPTNAAIGDELSYKRQTVAEPIECRTGMGVSKFKLNVKIRSVQTSDPNVAVENFWYFPIIHVWATDLEVPMRHWCKSHITWFQTKSMGRGVSNAPKLEGTVYIEVADVFNAKTNFKKPIAYLPYQNKITFK